MGMSRNVVQIFALLIVCSGLAAAQVSPGDAKHFNKEGLSYSLKIEEIKPTPKPTPK